VLVGLGVDASTIPATLDTATWRRMVLVALGADRALIPPTLDTSDWRQRVLTLVGVTLIPPTLDTEIWRRAALVGLGLALDSIPPTLDAFTWNRLVLAAIATYETAHSAFAIFDAIPGTTFTGITVSGTTPTTFSVSLDLSQAPASQVSAGTTETPVPDLTLP